MPSYVLIPAGPPGQDFANHWQMNELGVENTRVQNLNEVLGAELRALKYENASLTARLRSSNNGESDLQRELVEKDDILAVSTTQTNEVIAAVQHMMMQMDENGGAVGNEGGWSLLETGDGSNSGVQSNGAENNPALARPDELLKIHGGMLKQMQAETTKGKQYPK